MSTINTENTENNNNNNNNSATSDKNHTDSNIVSSSSPDGNEGDSSLYELLKDNDLRFTMELEFVELLANPYYLQSLAQNGLLNDDSPLIEYLQYLQYWTKPEYIKYLDHPHALYFLEILLESSFRKALLDPNYINLLHSQQYWHWRSYRYNRYIQYKQKLNQ